MKKLRAYDAYAIVQHLRQERSVARKGTPSSSLKLLHPHPAFPECRAEKRRGKISISCTCVPSAQPHQCHHRRGSSSPLGLPFFPFGFHLFLPLPPSRNAFCSPVCRRCVCENDTEEKCEIREEILPLPAPRLLLGTNPRCNGGRGALLFKFFKPISSLNQTKGRVSGCGCTDVASVLEILLLHIPASIETQKGLFTCTLH